MALANYTDLLAAVASWAHRGDLTAVIPDFVLLAEERIARDVRLRKQITNTILMTTAGVQGTSLPADWLAFENVSLAAPISRQLTYVNVEHLDSRFPTAYTGQPIVFSIEADKLLTGPVPDAAYGIDALYFARFPALATAGTNWLMTYNPRIYLSACLAEAMDYIRDDGQYKKYMNRYDQDVKNLQNVDDDSTHSGSALRVRTI